MSPVSCMDGCLVVVLLTAIIGSLRNENLIEDLEENVEFTKRLSHLASHGLTFQNEGFDRQHLAVTRHAFVVPAIQSQSTTTIINYSFKTSNADSLDHFLANAYRSWRVISTPTPWLGISILVLMIVAKFLRISRKELHEAVTYLKANS